MDESEQDLLKTVKYDRVIKPAPSAPQAPARSIEESKKILEEAFAESKADDLEATMRFRNVIQVPIPVPGKSGSGRAQSGKPGSKSAPTTSGGARRPTNKRSATDPKSQRRATRSPALTQDPDQSSQHPVDPLDFTERDEDSSQLDSDEIARGVIPREFVKPPHPRVPVWLVITISILSMIIGALFVGILVLAFRS